VKNFFPLELTFDFDFCNKKMTGSNRNFAFITFQDQVEALDAIDNMHLNILSADSEKILKVNLARNSLHNSNQKSNTGGFSNPNNRAIWDDETWIKENALKEDLKDDLTNKDPNLTAP
jgi:RNA recognition motif-containing protein